jgi:16S rRNA C967 or C1407 C5-methylase (RsmB/RsmF family)
LKKVVYSTCSKHVIENEEVVQHVLKLNSHFKLSHNIFPEWKRRGIKCEGFDSNDLIRTLSEEDDTIGFFVALFERI